MPEVLSLRSPAAPRKPKRRIHSATTLRASKPPPKGSVDYFDDMTPGLSLRVTANDVRTWTLFYRDKNGRQKRLTLRRFSSVSLADARELAREAQLKVAKGGDPVREKRAAREVLTFGDLADRYLEDHAKPTSGAGRKTSGSSTPACFRSGGISRQGRSRPTISSGS